MILKSEKFIPNVYKSRDYQALLALLDIVINTTKFEIDNLLDLYDSDVCPSEELPYLANFIGYIYNYTDTIQENRNIIKNFIAMIRNRGSETGITLAAALSLSGSDNKDFISDLAHLNIMMHYDTGLIEILYPREKTKVRNLLDWVRPVGMYIDLTPGTIITNKSAISVSDRVSVNVIPYKDTQFSGVEWDSINFSRVTNYVDFKPHTWQDMLDTQTSWANALDMTWSSVLEE